MFSYAKTWKNCILDNIGLASGVYLESSQGALTRAPLGLLDFHALLGGGCLNTPLLTRLLGHVAIRDRRRSKERQK